MNRLTTFKKFTLALIFATIGVISWGQAPRLKPSSTEDDTYLINDADDWALFVADVNGGYSYEGKTVKLTDNISVSTMVGVWSCFSGTFNGDGNTLNFYYNATDDSGYAPFYWTDGATITDLTVEGTINASAGFVAGLIYSNTQEKERRTQVNNVTVSVNITDGDDGSAGDFCAGFACYSFGLDFNSCVYNGKIKAGNFSGGFSASYDYDGPANFADCIFYPKTGSDITGSAIFADNIGTCARCYYTDGLTLPEQGAFAYTTIGEASAADDMISKEVTINGITVYGSVVVNAGIEETYPYDEVTDYYETVTGCTVTFDGEPVTATTGETVGDYTVTVTKNNSEVTEVKDTGSYKLVISGEESKKYYGSYSQEFDITPAVLSGEGTEAEPYIISSRAEWVTFANNINAGTNTDSYYKLTADISVSKMVGTNDHPFKGHFTAREDDTYNLYTLTFNYGSKETPTTDEIVAPFRYTDGATIEYLKVSGAIHTNVGKEAGLIGVNTKTSKNTSVYRVIVNLNFYCYEALWYAEGGGFAYDGKNITFEGCAYQGKISASNYHGGFCGNGNNTTTFTDCLFNPQGGTYWAENFVYNKSGNIDFTTCYYTEGANQETSTQGTLVYVGTVPTETIGRKITTLYGLAIYVPVAVVISDISNTYIYTGSKITVTPSVTFDDVDAIENDYCDTIIEPRLVKNVGNYTFTVTGSDYYDYAGSVTKDFRVVNSSSEGWNWLQTALSGSASTIDLEENVIYEAGPSDAALTIDRTVTINLHGSTIDRGLYSEVAESGQPGGQVLRIGNGATVIINGPGTIKGGNNQAENSTEHAEFSDAGGIWNMGNLTLNKVTVEYNRCEKYVQDVSRTARGGGIYSGIGSTLKIYGGSVNHNIAQGGGGGIYVERANEFSINKDNDTDSCYIKSNKSQDKGGGLRVDAINKPSTSVVIKKCSITYNVVSLHTNLSVSYGGGIHLDGGTLNMTNCEISNNYATRYGGGVYMVKGTINATDCDLKYNMSYDTKNKYTGYGGGICIMGGTYNMNGGMVYGNSSYIDNGGGIFVNTNTALTLTGTVFVTGNWKYNDKDTDKTSTTNVFIMNKGDGGVVTVLDGFDAQRSRIGVAKGYAKDWNPVFTSGLYDNGGTISNFVSDNTKYTIVRTTVGDPSKTSHGEAKFSEPEEWDPSDDYDEVNHKYVVDDTWIVNELITIPATDSIAFGENGCLIIVDEGGENHGRLTAKISNTDPHRIVINGGELIASKCDEGKDIYATAIKRIEDAYYLSDQNWYIISSPFNSLLIQGGSNLITHDGNGNNEYDLYRFNEAATKTDEHGLYLQWENYRGGHNDFATLENGRGYLYRNENDYTIATQGKLNLEAIGTYTLTYAGLNELRGFHLVGNPYSYNIQKGSGQAIPNTYLEDKYYVLRQDNGTWALKDDGETDILPLTGILVQAKAPEDDANNLVISPVPAPAPSASKGHEYQNDNIWFTVSNNDFSDRACVEFKEGHGLNKIAHQNENAPMLYIRHNDEDFASVDMGKDTKSIDLYFKTAKMSQYTLSVKPQGEFEYLHLYDKVTDEDIDLLKESEYEFVGSTADGADRFVVRLNPSTPSTGSGTEVFVWQSGNDIIVEGNGELQVFDVMGRLVSTQYVNGVETMCTSSLQTGVYVFRLNEKAQKIVIR